MFQFGQIQVSESVFYKCRQLVDLMSIELDKVVVSSVVPFKKDQKYVIGYQHADGSMGPLFIQTPSNVYSSGVRQYSEASPYQMGLYVKNHGDWWEQYLLVWEQIEAQLGSALSKPPVAESGWLNVKLNQYEGEIKTRFDWQDIPHNESCQVTAVMKLASVYKQGQNCWPQVYVEECRSKKLEQKTSLLIIEEE